MVALASARSHAYIIILWQYYWLISELYQFMMIINKNK
jgi:hypothetical protein